MPIKDLTGTKQGCLRVIKLSPIRVNKNAVWICRCTCGRVVELTRQVLYDGKKDCGCCSFQHVRFARRKQTPELCKTCLEELAESECDGQCRACYCSWNTETEREALNLTTYVYRTRSRVFPQSPYVKSYVEFRKKIEDFAKAQNQNQHPRNR